MNTPDKREPIMEWLVNKINRKKPNHCTWLYTFWLCRHFLDPSDPYAPSSGPEEQLVLHMRDQTSMISAEPMVIFSIAYGCKETQGTHYVGFILNRKTRTLESFDPGIGRTSQTYGGGAEVIRVLKRVLKDPEISRNLFNDTGGAKRFVTIETHRPTQRSPNDVFCQTWVMEYFYRRLFLGEGREKAERNYDQLPSPISEVKGFICKLHRESPTVKLDLEQLGVPGKDFERLIQDYHALLAVRPLHTANRRR